METKTLQIQYLPHIYQSEIHKDTSRFRVVVFPRQTGKTTLAVNELIKKAFLSEGLYFYLAPTYRQAEMIAWRKFKELLPKELVEKINESKLEIKLRNGSIIALKGADNEDSLRGVTLSGIVIDEYAQINKSVWDEIILPELAVKKAWALFIGTPKGKNHFYEVFKRGDSDLHPDYKSFHIDIYTFLKKVKGLVDKETIDEARKTISQQILSWSRSYPG